jgi:hypothetical protein
MPFQEERRKQLAKSIVLAVLLSLTGVSGCIFGGGGGIEPKIPTSGKKIAVIPFRENDLYYFESTLGIEMAFAVSQILLREADDMTLVNSQPAQALTRDKNPDKIEWDKVAEELGVDYVLTGHITLFRARDPKRHVNCYRGEMVVQLMIWRPDKSIALMETVTATHPSGRFSLPVLDMLSTTEEEVLNKLKARTAGKIAKLFYPHEPDED